MVPGLSGLNGLTVQLPVAVAIKPGLAAAMTPRHLEGVRTVLTIRQMPRRQEHAPWKNVLVSDFKVLVPVLGVA